MPGEEGATLRDPLPTLRRGLEAFAALDASVLRCLSAALLAAARRTNSRTCGMDGMGWDGMGWDRMGWDGMGWDGMGWDGTGRDGIGRYCVVLRWIWFLFVFRWAWASKRSLRLFSHLLKIIPKEC